MLFVPTLSFFESLLTFNEIILGHIQFFGMLNLIDVPWPKVWLEYSQWVSLFSLELNVNIPNIPTLDYRMHWVAVVIVIPLLMTFVTLIAFRPPTTVVWYFFTLGTVASTLAGIVAIFLPEVSIAFADATLTLLIAGAAGVTVSAIFYFINRLPKKNGNKNYKDGKQGEGQEGDDDDDDDDDDVVVKEHVVERKSLFSLLRTTLISAVFTLAGLLSLNIIDASLFASAGLADVSGASNTIKDLGDVFGRVFLGIGGLFFLYLVLCLTRGGRNLLDKISQKLQANFIKLVLFVLTAVYIPVTSTLASVWACVDLECPVGTSFPIALAGNNTERTYTAGRNECSDCAFLDLNECKLPTQLCPGGTKSVLASDVALSCADVQRFYLPASLIMVLAFVIGVPLLYNRLIAKHARYLRQVPVHLPSTVDMSEVEEEAWSQRLALSSNSAKNLYTAFEKKWRYYKLLLLVQKLSVVVCVVILVRFSQILATLSLVIHGLFLVFALYTQPFISNAQDMMATASGILITVGCLLSLLLALSIPVPDDVFVYVLMANVALPLVMTLGGVVFQRRQKKKAEMLRRAAEAEQARGMSEHDRRRQEMRVAKQDEAQSKVAKDVDRNINEFTLKTISNFFLAMGLLAFVSLALCVVGILYSDAVSPNQTYTFSVGNAVTTEQARQEQIAHHYAGYSSWTEFTDNCCCQRGTGVDAADTTVELWRCRNGRTKSRLREQKGRDSGLIFRPMCAHTFVDSCAPAFAPRLSPDANRYVPLAISGCSGNFTSTYGVLTKYNWERVNLW